MINFKNTYHESLKEYLRSLFIKTRNEHNLTQEQMAESLHIATRNYQNIENGKTLCSTETMILFWVKYTDIDTSKEIRREIEGVLREKVSLRI